MNKSMTLPVLYDRNILIGQFCEGSGATKYQMSLKTHLIFATTHKICVCGLV